jgi:hypothetical protein
MPELHDADVEMHWRCAAYRLRYGEWPTRLEVGPEALRALKWTVSAEFFVGLSELFEIVTLASRSDDVHSQLEMRFFGAAGAVSGEEGYLPRLKTIEEADEWTAVCWRHRHGSSTRWKAGGSSCRRADKRSALAAEAARRCLACANALLAVVSDSIKEALELFTSREEAEAIVQAWDVDEPEQVGALRVEMVELETSMTS